MTEREIFKKFVKICKIDWIQRVIKMLLLKILSWYVLLTIVKVKKKRGTKK